MTWRPWAVGVLVGSWVALAPVASAEPSPSPSESLSVSPSPSDTVSPSPSSSSVPPSPSPEPSASPSDTSPSPSPSASPSSDVLVVELSQTDRRYLEGITLGLALLGMTGAGALIGGWGRG